MKRLEIVRKIGMTVNMVLAVCLTYVFLAFFILALASHSEPEVLQKAVFGLISALAIGLAIVGAMAFRDYLKDWWQDGVKVRLKGAIFLLVTTTVLEMLMSAVLDMMISNHYLANIYGLTMFLLVGFSIELGRTRRGI